MAEAEKPARQGEQTLGMFLDGIAERYNQLAAEKGALENRMSADQDRLAVIENEMERIDDLLGHAGRGHVSKKEGNGCVDRASRAQARVWAVLEKAFSEGCTGIDDDHLVKTVREDHPDLSPKSILSAAQRLAKLGKIVRDGRRRARMSRPVPGSPQMPIEDKILDTLAKVKESEVTLQELSWACGGDTMALEAALKELAEKRRITVIVYETAGKPKEYRYQHKGPDKVEPIGTPLFDGMEPPR